MNIKTSEKQKMREEFELASQNIITTLSKRKNQMQSREQQLILNLLKKVQFIKLSFDTKSANYQNLCSKLELAFYSEKQLIFRKGEQGTYFYIVLYGKCSVLFQTQKQQSIHLYADKKQQITYYPGDSFGEISLIYNVPRGATVVAHRQTTLLKINKKHFNQCTKFQKKLFEMNEYFTQHPYLELASDFIIRIFSSGSTRQKFREGDVIVNEGKKLNYLLFFIKGKVKVLKTLKIRYQKKIAEQTVQLQQLSQNSVFGEHFLVNNLISNIKIVATDRGEFARVYLQEDVTSSDTPLARRILENAGRFPSEKQIFTNFKQFLYEKMKKLECVSQLYKNNQKKVQEFRESKRKYQQISKASLFLQTHSRNSLNAQLNF